jgi:alkanesulfonate monooxygenase SsuD/methylene tetrahydromethanopterin reductase-like flavin-dependent oxidoreductase (luciferase family)
MKYGVTLPNIGASSDPRVVTDLAVEVEQSGWDGVFVWDAIYVAETQQPGGSAACDPWVVMAAIAARTNRIRIGPMVTPLSRRRPWKVARETVSLDLLSGGRLILPVGLGATDDGGFARVGEALDRKVRAERLDEALQILDGLWSGEPFAFEGTHFQVQEMTFLPPPAQRPRIPVWVVGAWNRPKSMRRALGWDGILPAKMADDGSFGDMTPADIQDMKAYIAEHRSQTGPFDIVMEGDTPGNDPDRAKAIVSPLAEAGVTWWLESVWATPESTGGVEGMRARIRQGPPR